MMNTLIHKAKNFVKTKRKLLVLLLIFIFAIGGGGAIYLINNRNFDLRNLAGEARTTVQAFQKATGIGNVISGNPIGINANAKGLAGVFTLQATRCTPQNDRFEFVINKKIDHVFGLGMQWGKGKVALDDLLQVNFASGTEHLGQGKNIYLNADVLRMRTPMFVFPTENMIVAYTQPAVKMVRLTRDAKSTTVVLKKHNLYSDGTCAPLVIIKGNSIADAYTKYSSYLQSLNNPWKKPSWNAFGLGTETYNEYGCDTSLDKVQYQFNQYKNANIPLSFFVIGSGYYHTSNLAGCGDLDLPEYINEGTMDNLRVSTTRYKSLNELNAFFASVKQYGAYPIIGMRSTIKQTNVKTIEQKLKQAGTGAAPIYYSDKNLIGVEPSNNVRLLNVESDAVMQNYIKLLRAAYGNFMGIKEDEMLYGDQKEASIHLKQKDPGVNIPDGLISKVYPAYIKAFNNDLVIIGRNDWFSVGTDLQDGMGFHPGGKMTTYQIKPQLDAALTQVISGYPHPLIYPTYDLNSNGTIKNEKEYLRMQQFLTFAPGDSVSKGFWRLSTPAYKESFIFFGQLRDRLHQYAFDNAQDWYNTGQPWLMRPLYLDYPNDAQAYKQYSAGGGDEYMFGNAFLVAPVLSENDQINVYFPKGRWKPFLKGNTPTIDASAGGKTVSYDASKLNEYPIFVKEGEIFTLKDYRTGELLLQSFLEGLAETTVHTVYNKNGSVKLTVKAVKNRDGSIDYVNTKTNKRVRATPEPFGKGFVQAKLDQLL